MRLDAGDAGTTTARHRIEDAEPVCGCAIFEEISFLG
jgi:hypothetical protein